MPLPKPKNGETRAKFGARFDAEMSGDLPDQGLLDYLSGAQWKLYHPKAKNRQTGRAEFVGLDILSVPLPIVLGTDASGQVEVGTEVGADGVPHQLYRKEIMRDGDYEKETFPGSGVIDVSFQVTPALREHWASQFARMRDNGVEIPIVEDHIDGESDKAHGWIRELQNEDDSLFMVVEVIGEKGNDLVGRNDVSLFSPSSFTDGKGNEYIRPIKHVSFTPTPVIPGLKDFEVIAASFAPSQQREPEMDLTKLKDLVDVADGQELTDETAPDLVLSTLTARKTRIDELGTEIETLKKQMAEISASHGPAKPAEPDPQLLSLSVDNRGMKLNALMEAGAIDANARKRLDDLFVGTNGAALALSLKGTAPDPFSDLLEILRDNKPVSLGEQTGAQALQLAHAVNDPKTNPLRADAERRKKEVMEARRAG